MNLLYTAAQVRELDRVTIEEEGIPGITLMKRAGQACVDAMLGRWPNPGRVAVLCGSGNNAGDGFIIAGLLKAKGLTVQVGLVGREPAKGTDAASAYNFCRENGVEVNSPDEALEDAELIVDALLGTGVSGEVREDYAATIRNINGLDKPVVAVDLPSGLSADTGVSLGICVRADLTITFIGRKFGLMTGDGPEYAGEIQFADLEVPDAVFQQVPSTANILDYDDLIRSVNPRHRNAHKLDHGHVLIIGGDTGMGGAVAMAAE
ncbi:MAG: NAD(P)H-hydrate epimerase, partial [Gammaproteobacteria bacterium]|nr:NAD(P)H-hydrate epimerase [Gammaproteobacteria bacterium]